jgi:citrate synthase
MGFPTDMFPILFLIPRLAGWLSHWQEFLIDPENKIARPFQIYKGSGERSYEQASGSHATVNPDELRVTRSALNRRRDAALSQVLAANVYAWEK